ncbi:MAG: hypothetical protein WCK91_03480, partial [bacterium]
ELVSEFSFEKMQKAGGAFNEEKLDWMNREYLKMMSHEEQEEYISKFLPDSIKGSSNFSTSILHNMTPIVMEHISKGKDVTDMAEAGELSYFFDKPVYEKDSLFFKSSKIPVDGKYTTLASYLGKLVSIIESMYKVDFNKDKIKEVVWPYAEEVGRGDILWPMRFSLSGREKSPDPFTLAEVLGKEETLARLSAAIEILK